MPSEALLNRYSEGGAYADCLVTEIARTVAHAAYVEAFYTTPVFKLERLVLRWLVSRPSTDHEARQLAQGMRETFAAWTVEARAADQLLLADFSGRTKSWLMTEPAGGSATRLYFGSAVVPGNRGRDPVSAAGGQKRGLGFAFTALLGFHKLYSRVLLKSASARLSRS